MVEDTFSTDRGWEVWGWCGGNGSGGNGLRCRSRSGSCLRLSLLSEDRQSGYDGDDE